MRAGGLPCPPAHTPHRVQQKKIDVGSWPSYVIVAITMLVLLGSMNLFFSDILVESLWACFFSFLFGSFLVWDVSLIVGGKHRYAITPDEYILSALSCYLDVVQVFVVLIMCLIGRDGGGDTSG